MMVRLYRQISDFTRYAVDTVLPPRCVISGEMVDRQGMVSPQGWSSLDFISAPFCACCGVPFDFEVGAEGLCAGCLQKKPVYGRARAALVYDGGSRDMILGFKHGDKTHSVRAFVPWMMRAGAEILGEADYLVPVPLHSMRLLARRYNQAALMSFALSRACGRPTLPAALKRVRATVSQGHLNMEARQKNVRKAFAVHPKMAGKISGARVVLVDDVFTTGATVSECATVLLKAGALRVDVLTLARVVHSDL